MRRNVLAIAFTASILAASSASATPTFRAPGTTTYAACSDYATEAFGDPWDFSEPGDVPRAIKPRQYQNISEPQFGGGSMHLTSLTDDPYFSLTSFDDLNAAMPVPENQRFGINYPIDVSKFKRLTFRMKSDQSSAFQVFWKGVSSDQNYGIIDPAGTIAGNYRVYSVDLSTARLNDHGTVGKSEWSGENKRQLRLDPAMNANTNIALDWVMLTPDDGLCARVPATFTDSAGQATITVIDDNTDFSDGFHNIALSGTTGAAQTVQFPVSRLFPGAYRVYGFSSNDFASLYGDPWDFNQASDVESTNGLSSPTFTNGTLNATTNRTGASFNVRVSLDAPIDTSLFKRVTVRMNITKPTTGNGSASLAWYDLAGNLKGSTESAAVRTASGANTLTWDLSKVASWNGTIYDLRVIPDNRSGVTFQIPYVALTTGTIQSVEPVAAAQGIAPGVVTINSPKPVSFLQPDNHGGKDCPTHDFGNPWTMDSTNDIALSSHVVDASFLPYSLVVDQKYMSKVGDFYAGTTQDSSVAGYDDPKLFPISASTPIDADRCVNICYSMVNDLTIDEYHSVTRVTYLSQNAAQNGDDIVNPDGWEASEVCFSLASMKQEPDIKPGQSHPWHGKIDFFSLDPVEETPNTTFFLDYIEIREAHRASTTFGIVVDSSTDSAIDLYVSTQKPVSRSALESGAVRIGVLTPGRATNLFRWDVSSTPNGTYYLTAVSDPSGPNPLIALAPLPIVVDHDSKQDTTPPTLIVDSPGAGYQAGTRMQLAGAAFDDISLAVVEVSIDGKLVKTFKPTEHHVLARKSYPNSAPNNPGFNYFIDTSLLERGSHTLTYNAYDSSGNTSTYTAAFTAGEADSEDVTYPEPTQNSTGTIAFNPRAAYGYFDDSDGTNRFSVNVYGFDDCATVDVYASNVLEFTDPKLLTSVGEARTKSSSSVPYLSSEIQEPAIAESSTVSARKANVKTGCKAKARTCRSKCPKGKKGRACRSECAARKATCRGGGTTDVIQHGPVPPAVRKDDRILYLRAQCTNDASIKSDVSEVLAWRSESSNVVPTEASLLEAVRKALE